MLMMYFEHTLSSVPPSISFLNLSFQIYVLIFTIFLIFSPISISSILWEWLYDYLLYRGNIPQVTPLKKDDSPWTNSHQQPEVPHWRCGSLNSFTKARNLGWSSLPFFLLGRKGRASAYSATATSFNRQFLWCGWEIKQFCHYHDTQMKWVWHVWPSLYLRIRYHWIWFLSKHFQYRIMLHI